MSCRTRISRRFARDGSMFSRSSCWYSSRSPRSWQDSTTSACRGRWWEASAVLPPDADACSAGLAGAECGMRAPLLSAASPSQPVPDFLSGFAAAAAAGMPAAFTKALSGGVLRLAAPALCWMAGLSAASSVSALLSSSGASSRLAYLQSVHQPPLSQLHMPQPSVGVAQ